MKEIEWSCVLKSASPKRIFNVLKALTSFGMSKIYKKSIVWGKPFIVTIEPTIDCNLKCPQCLTGIGKVRRQEKLFNFQLFTQIIDEFGDYIWYLLLFNQGEPFLNPLLLDFIRLAKQKNIYILYPQERKYLMNYGFRNC